ncbi:hypothetical protein, partial [Labilibacter marinus]|uniref:hypothetical protein n=1 Tax=Labilibacter marinus TaxID=1477105 RepID=UPI00117A762E
MKKLISLSIFLIVGLTVWGQAPTISDYSPDRNIAGVLINQQLVLLFDQNIQFASGVIRIRRVSDSSIYESFDVDGIDSDS